jgi:aspartate/glutamate racemase
MTMEARFYPDEFERHGIEVVIPEGEERLEGAASSVGSPTEAR